MAVRSFYLMFDGKTFLRNSFKWLLIIFFVVILIGILFFKWPWIVFVVLILAAIGAKIKITLWSFLWEDYEYTADSYKKITINTNDKYLKLDEQKLFFGYIKQIDVEYNKTSAKACLIFVLKDGNTLIAPVQSRRVLIRIIDMLKSYIKTPDINNLRNTLFDAYFWGLALFMLSMVVYIIHLLSSN